MNERSAVRCREKTGGAGDWIMIAYHGTGDRAGLASNGGTTFSRADRRRKGIVASDEKGDAASCVIVGCSGGGVDDSFWDAYRSNRQYRPDTVTAIALKAAPRP